MGFQRPCEDLIKQIRDSKIVPVVSLVVVTVRVMNGKLGSRDQNSWSWRTALWKLHASGFGTVP